MAIVCIVVININNRPLFSRTAKSASKIFSKMKSSAQGQKSTIVIGVLFFVFFICFSGFFATYRNEIINEQVGQHAQVPKLSFHEIALKHGTDKVNVHSYHNAYTKYLTAIRSEKIKMLEIGLGCDMNYGPGKSFAVWDEYCKIKYLTS